MTQVRVPPGRAGERWLRRRIEVATRSAAVLERREQMLTRALRSVAPEADSACSAFETCAAEALLWLGRAVMTGGAGQVDRAAAHLGRHASLALAWELRTGLTQPRLEGCDLPDPGIAGRLGSTAAFDRAAEAYSAAVKAAVADAIARRIRDSLAAELALTVQRRRGLVHRWVPRLQAALSSVEQALDDAEIAEAIRARRAVRE